MKEDHKKEALKATNLFEYNFNLQYFWVLNTSLKGPLACTILTSPPPLPASSPHNITPRRTSIIHHYITPAQNITSRTHHNEHRPCASPTLPLPPTLAFTLAHNPYPCPCPYPWPQPLPLASILTLTPNPYPWPTILTLGLNPYPWPTILTLGLNPYPWPQPLPLPTTLTLAPIPSPGPR
ncbi:extensin-like [Penaeus chinensis]|uniref:extensin-like n=1 Tax=Penaeus chinensis TaxID=139456 RepID=UPI001FB62F47|nr:extensin-like [Penaeus chinensis]